MEQNGDNKKTSTKPSLFCALGSETSSLQDEEIREQIEIFLEQIVGPKEDVLLLPPDYTRFHSGSGKITSMVTDYYGYTSNKSDDGNNVKPVPRVTILPTLGTHAPMTPKEIKSMFGEELAAKDPSPFLVHDWRNDVETIGHVPAEMVSKATHGMVHKPWPAQLNKVVWEKRKNKDKSVVLSIGQVVPHEVMGMANFNKNMFVGAGGLESINLSHFIGAVHGMENIMGRSDNPLRAVLNYASQHFLQGELDLWYILTVIGSDSDGKLAMRGFFIGNDIECYSRACELSLKVNFTMLDRPPKKVVVTLDEDEYHSTWLGNKAIYRTRMAIADGGELIILGPGVKKFGEDGEVDKLIRKYGYIGTPKIMKAMDENEDLKESLGTVAHLIHGSSEGRFSITWCPGHLTQQEIEMVGFQYASLAEMSQKYNVENLRGDGWHKEEGTGEEFYFIQNPALGLWAVESRFDDKKDSSEESDAKKPRLDD